MSSLPLSPVSPQSSFKMNMRKQSWQQVATHERALLLAKIPAGLRLPQDYLDVVTSHGRLLDIPRQCGLLSPMEVDITESDATILVTKLTRAQISSVAVTTAFCKRAAIAHQLVNCLTEIMFDEALSRAVYCDEYLAREQKVIGPLHGLPISLQDTFNIKGIRSTIGYVEFLKHQPSTSNSALVDVLVAQGAVLYVKTNVPQTLMASDTQNNIFGQTGNPYGHGLSAGGTAGGESALIAMRGSVLGIGTDLAGGLRVPSMCCGLVGFKPSANRLPSGGQTQAGRRGGFGFHSSVGPIAHNVRDAEYLIQSIAQFDSWVFDDTALSIPWKPFAFTGPKRFGVIFEDPKYLLHPPVARNFREVIHKLTAASHQVISLANILPEDNISTTAFTAMTILNMDPEKTAHGFVARGNEPLVPSIASITMPELAKIKPNINGVFNLNNDISNVRAMFREVIVKHQLDAVLMPVYQSTAVEHDQLGVPAYTLLANLLDYPACTIPYGYADKVLDAPFVRDVRYKPPYIPDVIEGVPCAIQIMGRNLKDEDLLAHAKVVEDVLRS